MELTLREDVFKATIKHDLSFYDEHPSGKIVSRVKSDTQDFSNIATLVMDLLSQGLLVVILSVWLFSNQCVADLAAPGMSPFAAAIALNFRRIARNVTQHFPARPGDYQRPDSGIDSGIIVAKSFRQERSIYKHLRGE